MLPLPAVATGYIRLKHDSHSLTTRFPATSALSFVLKAQVRMSAGVYQRQQSFLMELKFKQFP